MGQLYNPLNDGFERLFRIETTPMAKPRMTHRDRWKKRPIVQRWNAYKDFIRLSAPRNFRMPISDYWLIFTFKPPSSWDTQKIITQYGAPHMTRPDKDNLEKAILDIFLPNEDSMVFDGRASKLWGAKASIELWWKDGSGSR